MNRVCDLFENMNKVPVKIASRSTAHTLTLAFQIVAKSDSLPFSFIFSAYKDGNGWDSDARDLQPWMSLFLRALWVELVIGCRLNETMEGFKRTSFREGCDLGLWAVENEKVGVQGPRP